MLLELSIENLALFERARLELGSGLNVITGETGAGKSLLVDALELLLGDRPKASMVRKGAAEARVEGRFELTALACEAPELRDLLAELLPALLEEWRAAPADAPRELILTRAVTAEGRSRAWIDHRPVTQRALRDLAARLVEIHGQNEHQRLLETGEQRRLLDLFGEVDAFAQRYREARTRWIAASDAVIEFERRARERRDRLDLLRYQAGELADAKLSLDEHTELVSERDRLRYANDVGRDLGAVVAELSAGDTPALDAVRRARRVLEAWQTKIADLAGPAGELGAALEHLEEACATLETFVERIEASPERLETVEERLYRLDLLAKKYRVDLAGLIALQRDLARELAEIDGREEKLDELAVARAKAFAEVEALAAKLTAARLATAKKLERAVAKSLGELGLEKARFQVLIAPREAPPNVDASRDGKAIDASPGNALGSAAHGSASSARKPRGQSAHDTAHPRDHAAPSKSARDASADAEHAARSSALAGGDDLAARDLAERRRFAEDGADRVEYLLAANPGEDAQPLRQVASGGEAARIMLALRTALATKQTIPTLVFDEVDSGVGGRLGPKVGEHLRALGESHQIVCVTHLPAIAAIATRHFKVSKAVAKGRTSTHVATLEGEARVDEVADMIAGGAAHATARAEAKRLLEQR